eukprot:scaffold143753_cov133-Phaeocystis_antarctica.AAC.1
MPHHTYSRKGRCSLATPCLRRQGSLLRYLPHHTPTHVGCAARLPHPTCDGRARCSDACITPTRVGRAAS